MEINGYQGANSPLLESCLAQRKILVVVGGQASQLQHITVGVPQRHVLGLTIFSCFINDLLSIIRELVGRQEAGSWNKQVLFRVVGNDEKADYYLNSGSLGKGEVQRDLGVMMEQSLKVAMQMQQAVRKANGMLAFIVTGFKYRTKQVLLQFYRVL
eukprot:g32550.t1